MASEMSRRVGKNIRRRRKELKLLQRQLAERFPSAAVDHQRISDWERGVNQPSGRYQDELLTALELEDMSSLYAPAEGETPDLMGALGGNEQLDRIEQQGAANAAALADLTRWIQAIDKQLQARPKRRKRPAGDAPGGGSG